MPSFKKIISAFCAAAMVATTAVVPVFAADIVHTFDDVEPVRIIALEKDEQPANTSIEGLSLYVGNRADGGSADTNFSIEAGGYGDEGNALVLNSDRYCSGGRGPRMAISTPSGDSIKTTMKVKKNATQVMNYSDSTSSQGTNVIPVPADDEWHDLGIYITGGSRMFVLDGTIVATDIIKTMPVIWGTSADGSGGKLWMDDITIGEMSEREFADVTISTIDLKTYTEYNTDGEGTVITNAIIVPTEDASVYGVSAGTFGVDVNVGGLPITWTSDNDLVEVHKPGRGKITVHTASQDTDVTLTAEATEFGIKRDFTLKIQGTEAFLDYVATLIDLTDGNASVRVSEDEGIDYEIVSNFTAPTALNGATISWKSDDANVIINGGSINLKSWDETEIILTAVISSGGISISKDFKLSVPAARVFYDESFDEWTPGHLVDLGKTTNNEHPGYSLSSGSRDNSATAAHYISIDAGGPTGSTNFVNNVLTQYNDNGDRPHSMTFTNMQGATLTKDLYANFDFRLNNASTTLRVTDGSSYIDLGASLGLSANVWYNLVLTVKNGGSYKGVITNSNTGAVVKTISGTDGPSRISRFEGTANYYSFAFDNLYIASGNVPSITETGETNITKGQSVEIAKVENHTDVEVSIEPALSGVTAKVEGGVVTIEAAANAASGSANVTITAKNDIDIDSIIPIVVGDDQTFADTAAAAIKSQIVNGTTVKDAGDDKISVSSGNLSLPSSLYNAKITWESSQPGAVTTAGVVYPKLDGPDTVELTATVLYNGAKKVQKITVDLTPYKETVRNELAAAKTSTETIPYTDSVTKNIVNLNIAKDPVILNDITFPTTAKATDTISVSWDVEENDYLSSKGEISVPDTDAHDVKITRTITYKKGSTTLAEDVQEYNTKVQFNPKDVENFLIGENTGVLWNENEEYPNRAAYLKKMVYDYIVKFDAALEENFEGIPSSTTSDFTVKTKSEDTVFGSTISWASSLSTVITARTDGTMKVTQPSSTSTVTLTATCSYENADPVKKTFKVSVTGTGSGSNGGGGGGGGYSNGGGTRPGSSSPVIGGNGPVSMEQPGVAATNPNPSGFVDLDSVPWALTAINNLYVSGVINGKTPNRFYPNDSITRAEFAKILIGAFDIPTISVSGATFSDVSTGHWASVYIETAYQKGIITGYDDGTFDPNANVTRQDMAVMVQRAASTMGYSLNPKKEAVEFTDAADIASYAQAAVSTLQQAGIVNGVGDGAFEPLSTSTRAQACQMIYNVFN